MGIKLSPTARDLTRSTFFGKDFDTYRQEIIDSIGARFGASVASNIVASEQGIMLIEMNAYALSTLSWYGDRQADDTTLRDARLRFAAVTIARQLGYKARSAVPATADITVLLAASPPVQLTINRGQKVSGPEGLVFETVSNLVFDVGQIGSGAPANVLITSLIVDFVTVSNIYASSLNGIFKTANSGVSWSSANTGLSSPDVKLLVMDPTNPLIIYAATSLGGVFKTINGATTWTPQNTGLSNLKTLSFAINPVTPTNLLVGTNSSGIFKSINGGASWVVANGGITDFVIQALAFDPVTPTTAYAGTYSQGVFKTINGGTTWTQTSFGLATLNIADIAVDPSTPATLYVATTGGGVYRSVNGGGIWAPINTGLTGVNANTLAIHPSISSTIYVTTDDAGLFKTTNANAITPTWAASGSGITVTDTTAIAIDPSLTTRLYAGTLGGGIFGTTNAAVTWSPINTGIDDPIKTVSVREGVTLQETFRSDGTPGQTFELSTIPTGKALAQSTPQITVGGILWPEVSLLSYEQTDQVEVEYGFNPPRIVFGDGIAGNIPPKDAQIVVNYFATSGTGGAIASNTISAFIGPLIAGITPIGAKPSNAEPSTPGSDPETIDSIKVNAPLVFQAARRSVTKTDLDGWINSYVDPTYGAVSKGRATTPRSAAADAEALTIIGELTAFGVPAATTDRLSSYLDRILSSNCEANVVVAQILAADSLGRYVVAPVGLVNGLDTFLNSISESTVNAVVVDGSVNLLSVDLYVEVGVISTYISESLRTQVQDNVRTAVQSLLIGRDFGVSLRIGDIYQTVEAIDGVDYSHTRVTVKTNEGIDVSLTRLDQFGDLTVQDYEVITMGATPQIVIL